MKRGSQWTWGCPCLPVVPSGCVFWNLSAYQLHVFVQPTHQGLQECGRCEDVSLSATSDRCLLLIILGEVTMCLLLSDWGESNVLILQTGIALRLCNHSLGLNSIHQDDDAWMLAESTSRMWTCQQSWPQPHWSCVGSAWVCWWCLM